MSSISIHISTDRSITPADFNAPKQANRVYNNWLNLIKGLANGAINTKQVDVHYNATNAVAASGTVTITHASVVNGDTVTIGGTVITAATSGNGTTSWTIGASATADATAMAACINANTTLNKYLVATASVGVVTLTCAIKGVIGNAIVLATSNAPAFALVAMASGAGGTSGAPTSY